MVKPNYNLNHQMWPGEDNWKPPSPNHFEEQYGFNENRRRDFNQREFGANEFDRRDERRDEHFDHPPRYDHHTMIGDNKCLRLHMEMKPKTRDQLQSLSRCLGYINTCT